jgi:hypothetical protein
VLVLSTFFLGWFVGEGVSAVVGVVVVVVV